MYMGSGGAPEGVLAAGALKALGGQIWGRLCSATTTSAPAPKKAGSPISTASMPATTWCTAM